MSGDTTKTSRDSKLQKDKNGSYGRESKSQVCCSSMQRCPVSPRRTAATTFVISPKTNHNFINKL